MLVISLGAGAQNLILGEVRGLGTNTIAVIPGKPTGPSDVSALYSDSLKPKDLTALENKANVPRLRVSIMPTIITAGSASYQSNDYQVGVFGATDHIADIFDLRRRRDNFSMQAMWIRTGAMLSSVRMLPRISSTRRIR